MSFGPWISNLSLKAWLTDLLFAPILDLPFRRSCIHHDFTDQPTSGTNRAHGFHRAHTPRNHHADWTTFHPSDQHPSARVGPRLPRVDVGWAPVGACLCCRAQLFRNGSTCWVVDGKIGCNCGLVGGAQGSGTNESRGVFGMDWYVILLPFYSPSSQGFMVPSIYPRSRNTYWIAWRNQQPSKPEKRKANPWNHTVIFLIAAEILVAGINIIVDLYAGVSWSNHVFVLPSFSSFHWIDPPRNKLRHE